MPPSHLEVWGTQEQKAICALILTSGPTSAAFHPLPGSVMQELTAGAEFFTEECLSQ